jgi:hypothetical protein
MKMTELKALAGQRGVRCGKMNKTELIRAMQSREGNIACFNTGQAQSCGQDQCLWRDDCR